MYIHAHTVNALPRAPREAKHKALNLSVTQGRANLNMKP